MSPSRFFLMEAYKSQHPSRLWWCPTGASAFLPIHAAGVYDGDATDCISHYAISSYAPTLQVLLDRPSSNTTSSKFTVVLEPNAPKCTSLPGAEKELKIIQSHIPGESLTILRSPNGFEVMKHLQQSAIVHFACHGVQDSGNPLDSGLIFADGCLTLSEIIRGQDDDNDNVKHVERRMSLAFLSACQTAVGDKSIPDEAMHLAATLLFAGFRGVVGTMGNMQDLDGPKVADTFYEYLFKDFDPNTVPPQTLDLTKAAEALHFAVLKLRKEPGMTFCRWVPFVHYGL
ncbi:CHAT domain-containing protein [Mycena pura]|uniref:CHAT domain-containing protein n=1 Tax=Mycena pura TaxID=153505 RepID=A0AAD6Y617_9AGAR|nr:CHAT domain-containing protein [Mycena pura]